MAVNWSYTNGFQAQPINTIIEAVKTIMQSIRRDLSLPIRYIYMCIHYCLTTKNICLPIRYIIENN